MGIPYEIIEVIPNTDKIKLVETYLSDPNAIKISNSTLEIDVLSELNALVNASDIKLLNSGYSQEQIRRSRAIINLYNNTSDEVLLQSGLSQKELNDLRAALDPSTDWSAYPKSMISTAKLTFTQTVTQPSASNNNTEVNVSLYFNWISPYYTDQLTDKIVISWGGNLKQTSLSERISYYDTELFGTSFTDYLGRGNAYYSETAINAMGIYEFEQSIDRNCARKNRTCKNGGYYL